MGLIDWIFGSGTAVREAGRSIEGVAEVFTVNRTKAELAYQRRAAGTSDQFAQEFDGPPGSAFDAFIDGLNRLPRPAMAFGTLGLFIFAMADPAAFSQRMQGLAYVPEPLWWLLGAVVSFYFGARELHYRRIPPPPSQVSEPAPRPEQNPAVEAWRAQQGQ